LSIAFRTPLHSLDSIAAMFGGLTSMFRGFFDFLGLFPRDAKICFLGLDNAGKTTLLLMMKENKVGINKPTLYPQNEEFLIQNIRFRTFDLGGHETARRIWKDYYTTVNGIVFIVDAADRTRFEEAREELQALLREPALEDVPVVVLGNKIDIPVAASEDELRYVLGLPHHVTADAGEKGGRPVQLFMCSIVKRMGYSEAFQWLSKVAF